MNMYVLQPNVCIWSFTKIEYSRCAYNGAVKERSDGHEDHYNHPSCGNGLTYGSRVLKCNHTSIAKPCSQQITSCPAKGRGTGRAPSTRMIAAQGGAPPQMVHTRRGKGDPYDTTAGINGLMIFARRGSMPS
jgi:hypothetical protein